MKSSKTYNRFLGSIRSQLALGFGLMLFLALAIAIIGYQSLQNLRTKTQITIEEATRIRELSLEIETEFLQARQDEATFMSTWRSLGFETAQANNVPSNELHLARAREKLNELEQLVQNSEDQELQHVLDDSTNLTPLLNTYESTFRTVVSDIEQRSRPDGQENTLYTTLNEIEAIVSPLPNPEFYQLVLQIRSNEQAYLNSGQQQYYDNLRFLILDFNYLAESYVGANLSTGSVRVPASKLLDLIKVYQDNLNGLIALEGDIEVNTIVFREVTEDINQLSDHILEEGNAGFIRARNQLQKVSNRNLISLTAISALALGLGSLAAFGLTRRIIGPLQKLSYTAQRLGEGDLKQTAPETGSTELTTVANSLNRMTAQIRELVGGLEQRVSERTAEIEEANRQNEQRARQFEAITLVGNAISSIRSLDELLPKVTELISQQFGYYHAGIFLNDANNEYAVLSAANSEGGQRMLNRGHKLKVGEQGIVGYATSTGDPRIALNVGEDAVYFDNPDMPDTRSEIALPLKIGETIAGALDVQSTEANAFSEEDINVLSLLADQVSLAIENARLFDQARKSLAESEALYRQYLRQAWNKLPKEQNLAGFRYNIRGASPIDAKQQSDTLMANEEDKHQRISVPIAIRGETIGTLSVQVPDSDSFNEDQMDLVNAVAERVALSAENARLFEETTRRAERERLVSDITVKIRSTNDPDTMIETALEELKQALGASKVQLIPHTIQKRETRQQLKNTMDQFNVEPSKKSRKN